MEYCPHGGRFVNEGDVFCANCARRLFLKINTGALLTKGRWVSCPKCYGAMFIDDPDCSGKGRTPGLAPDVEQPRQVTGKIRCNYSGCRNGQVWIDD